MITLYGPYLAGIALVAGFVLHALHKTAVDAARRNGRNEVADFLLEAIDPQPSIVVSKFEWRQHHPAGNPDYLNVVNSIGKNEYVRMNVDPFESEMITPRDWEGWENEKWLASVGGLQEYRIEVAALEWVQRVHERALLVAGRRPGATIEPDDYGL